MNSAQADCKSKGGNVVSINSQDELNYINSFASSLLSSHDIWVYVYILKCELYKYNSNLK